MPLAAEAATGEPDRPRRPLDPTTMGRLVDQLAAGLVDVETRPPADPMPVTTRAALDQLAAFLDDPTYEAPRRARAVCLIAGATARVGASYRRWFQPAPDAGGYAVDARPCPCGTDHPPTRSAEKVAALIAVYLNKGPDALVAEVDFMAHWAPMSFLAAVLNEAAVTWGHIDRATRP